MLRIVLFYERIMQENEASIIREGEKNVSLQSSEVSWGNRDPIHRSKSRLNNFHQESRKYEQSKKPTRKLLERKTNARAIQSLPPEGNGAPFQWSALQQS